jgi:hypothetical protein
VDGVLFTNPTSARQTSAASNQSSVLDRDIEEAAETSNSVEQEPPPLVDAKPYRPPRHRGNLSREGLIIASTLIVAMVLAIILLSLGLTGIFDRNDDGKDDIVASLSTLDRIRQEGVLRCVFLNLPQYFDENGELQGFYASFVRTR